MVRKGSRVRVSFRASPLRPRLPRRALGPKGKPQDGRDPLRLADHLTDADVHRGLRQASAIAQGQEPVLQLAPGARRGGDGDASLPGRLLRQQRGAAVQADAGSPLSPSSGRERHVDRPTLRRQQPPEGGGAAMAEHGIRGAFWVHITNKAPRPKILPPPGPAARPRARAARNPWGRRSAILRSASRLGPGFSLVTASVRQRGEMARGDVRIAVTLACEDCKRRNYQTNKSRRNSPDRVELRKFCRWCGRHTAHKETR